MEPGLVKFSEISVMCIKANNMVHSCNLSSALPKRTGLNGTTNRLYFDDKTEHIEVQWTEAEGLMGVIFPGTQLHLPVNATKYFFFLSNPVPANPNFMTLNQI